MMPFDINISFMIRCIKDLNLKYTEDKVAFQVGRFVTIKHLEVCDLDLEDEAPFLFEAHYEVDGFVEKIERYFSLDKIIIMMRSEEKFDQLCKMIERSTGFKIL